jgi:uncharacterized protein (TIGR03437 family)
MRLRTSTVGFFLLATLAVSTPISAGPVITSQVVNAATFQGFPGAGSIGVVFGTGLASAPLRAQTLSLPTLLGNTRVQISDERGYATFAPLLYVSPTQVNFQVPREWVDWYNAANVFVDVIVGGESSNFVGLYPLTFSGSGPAIFSINSAGTGQGAILIANTSIVAAHPSHLNGARSAVQGGFVSIFCMNLGEVRNAPIDGHPAPSTPLAQTVLTPLVTIGGIPALVTYSGLAPGTVGLYQVDVQVPLGAPVDRAVPVTIKMDQQPVSNTVTMSVTTESGAGEWDY